jgi:DNA processing protein
MDEKERPMSEEFRKEAVNYATVLALVNYSRARLRKIPSLKAIIKNDNPDSFCAVVGRQLGVSPETASKALKQVSARFAAFPQPCRAVHYYDAEYPPLLKKTERPPLFLFCRGDLNLFQERTIAVVGSRQPSSAGARRSRKLARLLVRKGFVIVSGLARGIDANAHRAAIENQGRTIAVIGTPLDRCYPKEHTQLQEEIAANHLLVSEFPFGHPVNRASFPTRNYTMSGISQATVIVEASDTSGALIQARQCISQGHHLFLLQHLINRNDLTWPRRFLEKGAFVVSNIDDVPQALQTMPPYSTRVSQEEMFPEL